MDDLIKAITQLKQKMGAHIPVIRRDIDHIITAKMTDELTIERTLDTLLDYGQLGLGQEEFRRLNGYYATIRPEYAERYNEFYAEMNTE